MKPLTIKIDPRNPPPEQMVHNGSTHPSHADLRKTLNLLSYSYDDGGFYIIVEGMSFWPETYDELQAHSRYYYEEHTCPINFLGVEMVWHNHDTDPHGMFKFERAVWMTQEYEALEGNAREEYLCTVFRLTEPSEAS